MRRMSDTLDDEDARPWFLWDEDITIGELRAVLQGPSSGERDRLLGKLLREARDVDVWHFVQVADVVEALPRVQRRLGRRAAFWTWLVDGWRHDGLIP